MNSPWLPENKRIGDYIYYCVIGVLSLVALVFLPMVGSDVGMSFTIPNTAAGWVVFIMSKLLVATINILLFHSFVKQARLNVRDNPNYQEAVQILQLISNKTYIPRSLDEFNRKEYGTKGLTVFITSILSAFSLSQALLTYDWMSLLTYIFVITMGVIFGILEMKKYEEYYITEYLDYAKYIQKKITNNDDGGEPSLVPSPTDTGSPQVPDITTVESGDSSPILNIDGPPQGE